MHTPMLPRATWETSKHDNITLSIVIIITTTSNQANAGEPRLTPRCFLYIGASTMLCRPEKSEIYHKGASFSQRGVTVFQRSTVKGANTERGVLGK